MSKAALLLIAGLLWIGVGIMLIVLAYEWLSKQNQSYIYTAALTGILCALLIHHFGFLRIVDKNLARILPMEGRRCVFAFMPWKSYLLIALMILFGFLLRQSPVPQKYLAILYLAIGTALILSSVRYLRYLIATLRNRT